MLYLARVVCLVVASLLVGCGGYRTGAAKMESSGGAVFPKPNLGNLIQVPFIGSHFLGSTTYEVEKVRVEWDYIIITPKATGAHKTFPLISFAHGGMGGKFSTYIAYRGWLHYVAAQGYVIVAMTNCRVCGVYGQMRKKQLALITRVKKTKYAKMIDFSKVGVAGHSMGAGATCATAMKPANNVVAAVAMHPSPAMFWRAGKQLKIPVFFAGGAMDEIVPPAVVFPTYWPFAAKHSWQVVPIMSEHNEPGGPLVSKLAKWHVKFFDCHLKSDMGACKLLKTDMCLAVQPTLICLEKSLPRLTVRP